MQGCPAAAILLVKIWLLTQNFTQTLHWGIWVDTTEHEDSLFGLLYDWVVDWVVLVLYELLDDVGFVICDGSGKMSLAPFDNHWILKKF